MSELEKILRKSIGKTVTVRYTVMEDAGQETITGTLTDVTDELIVVSAVMLHYINRKITTLIGLDVKE